MNSGSRSSSDSFSSRDESQGILNSTTEFIPDSMARNDAGYTIRSRVGSIHPGQVGIQRSANLSRSSQRQSHIQQPVPQRFQYEQNSMLHEPHWKQSKLQSSEDELPGFVGSVNLEEGIISNQTVPQTQVQLSPEEALYLWHQLPNFVQTSGKNLPRLNSSLRDKLLQQQMEARIMQKQQQEEEYILLQQQKPHLWQQQQQEHMLQLRQKQQQMLGALSQQRLKQSQQKEVPAKLAARPAYVKGTCSFILAKYLYQQRRRPTDNNLEFWRKFVSDFFTNNAKKRLCVSPYVHGSLSSDVIGSSHKDWHCQICNRTSFGEANVEVLPRLLQIKYESPTLEELLYVDLPHESHNSSGQIVLRYGNARQEGVYKNRRILRDGQLRIVFSPDLKIYSWEFCARRHVEFIQQDFIKTKVHQLVDAAQNCCLSAQNAPPVSSKPDLESNFYRLSESVGQLTKALELETSLFGDYGYTKRYMRFLQMSSVINSMKDVMDSCQVSGKGPIESFEELRNSSRVVLGRHDPALEPQQQQTQGNALYVDLTEEQFSDPATPTTHPDSSRVLLGRHDPALQPEQQKTQGNALYVDLTKEHFSDPATPTTHPDSSKVLLGFYDPALQPEQQKTQGSALNSSDLNDEHASNRAAPTTPDKFSMGFRTKNYDVSSHFSESSFPLSSPGSSTSPPRDQQKPSSPSSSTPSSKRPNRHY
ncbi:transcriptional corepressor SEUSS-like isoform X2 [Mercurialis annua]|uniref:transcriptional corepressor SEUSS-like isoform X2 n=1 Tax=Mercurialis annua TaxID=3986 RepID=UPI00215E4A44|nr:transcriptional corepressor SEUSS-like isoform X2 [Mercurialis annua]